MQSARTSFAALRKKELIDLFLSPVTAAGFLLFLPGAAVPFFFPDAPAGSAFLFGHYAARLPFVSAIVLPALSIGVRTGGRNSGTRRPVFAKFGALLSVWTVLLALTLPVLIGVEPPGAGVVVTTYLLLFVYGSACLAMGQFFSLLIPAATVAYLVTAALLLSFNAIQTVFQAVSLPVWISSVFLRLSFAWHLEAATRGIFDSRDFLFYLIATAAMLEATAVLVERRKIDP